MIDYYREVSKIMNRHFNNVCFFDEDIDLEKSSYFKVIEEDIYIIYVEKAEPVENKEVYKYNFEVVDLNKNTL